jgi:hypothetical protein
VRRNGEKRQSWRTCPSGAAAPYVERTLSTLHLGSSTLETSRSLSAGPEPSQTARTLPSQTERSVGGGAPGETRTHVAQRSSPQQPWVPLGSLLGRSPRETGAESPAPNLRGVAASIRVRRDASYSPSDSGKSWTSFSSDPAGRRSREQDRPLVSELPGAAAAYPGGCGAALSLLPTGLTPSARQLISSQAWVSSRPLSCRHPRKHGPSYVLSLSGAATTDPCGRGAVPLEQPRRTPKEPPRGVGAESSPRQIPVLPCAGRAGRRRNLTLATRGGEPCLR